MGARPATADIKGAVWALFWRQAGPTVPGVAVAVRAPNRSHRILTFSNRKEGKGGTSRSYFAFSCIVWAFACSIRSFLLAKAAPQARHLN